MSLTPHSVRVAAARLVAANEAIARYCAENFGRGLQVFVDRCGLEGLPGEDDAPYAWIYTDGENELGNVDAESFEFVVEVGAVNPAIRPSYTLEAQRTESANGLVLGGIAAKIEELRELVFRAIAGGAVGAMFNTASRTEDSVTGFPLEYAALRMNFTFPETLDSLLVEPPTVPAAEDNASPTTGDTENGVH